MGYRAYGISTKRLLRAARARSRRIAGASIDSQFKLPLDELEFLTNNLVGHVVLPNHPSYQEERKLFNHRFDPHPSAIVHCLVERDVKLCLDAVRRNKTRFRIRAGGSSFAGYSANDGVVVDVSGLNDVCIDSARLVATVGSGCSLAKLRAVLDDHEMHLPLADAKAVRVGGFMQGGGFGSTSRTFGINSDRVLAVRVMLADRRIVQASETLNHDLWWAVRGGTGGNFGVLLTTSYRLHPAPKPKTWCLGWRLSRDTDLDNAVSALMTLQSSFTRSGSPIEMNVSVAVLYLADTPEGPPHIPCLVMSGTYIGKESAMDALLAPLLANPGCWPMFQPLLGTRPGQKFDRYSRLVSCQLRPNDWRSILSHFLAGAPNRLATLQIDVWGGAISSYARDKSAFIHRDAVLNIALTSWWQDAHEASASRAFLSSWSHLMTPLWNGHIYQNFPNAEAPDYRWNYWGEAFPALLGVKRKYDPDGLFDFPQAIKSCEQNATAPAWPPG